MTNTDKNLPIISIENMIDEGWLTPAVFYSPAITDYDFMLSGAERYVVQPYIDHCNGKRAIAFCSTVAHCEAVAAEFIRHGIPAAAVVASQNSAERKANLERFQASELLVLTTCNVLLESSMPEVDAIIIATPTDSRFRFNRFVAAGLKPRPEPRGIGETIPQYETRMTQQNAERRRAWISTSGKPHAIILDMVGNVLRHGPIGDRIPMKQPAPAPGVMVPRRTTELTGPALRYAVASAEGLLDELRWWHSEDGIHIKNMWTDNHGCWEPDKDWAIGGPLLTKYAIAFEGKPGGADGNGTWMAYLGEGPDVWEAYGDEHLVAACRSVVLRHLGAIVQIPADIANAK